MKEKLMDVLSNPLNEVGVKIYDISFEKEDGIDTLFIKIDSDKVVDTDLCKQVSSANCKRLFSKPIIQYDKLMNIISEYESLSEAARQTKINAQNISSVCLGKNKSAGGYVWKYKQ